MPRDIRHLVVINADASVVYRAFTTQEGLSSFWTSKSVAEPRVGTENSFNFVGGAPYALRMKVDRLVEGRSAHWSSPGDFPNWIGTTIDWEVSPSERGTGVQLLFRQMGFPDTQSETEFAAINHHWGQILDALKAYAETGVPQPALG